MESHSYWVWVERRRVKDSRTLKVRERYVIVLNPLYRRREPVNIRPVAFLYRNSFRSEEQAKGIASMLFGRLAWKSKDGRIRARLEIAARSY